MENAVGRPIRVLSWNVFNENPDTARIEACLDETAPDVALLQEATPAHLCAVRARFANVVVARDYLLKGAPCFLVIATDLELSAVSVIEHFPDTKPPPSLLGRFAGWIEFLDTLSAEIRLGSSPPIRLVVAHPSAAVGPGVRREELEAAGAHIPAAGPCIFAADFNSFSEPWLAPLFALPLAYRVGDFACRERRQLDTWFAARGFAPAVRGVTFPRWRLQMDQVFVRGLIPSAARILSDTWGSDHRPIVIDLDAGRPDWP